MSEPTFYLGVVPARAGSKRIPGKNLATLGGKPLIDYTLNAALRSRRLGATVVSTDSVAIAERARALGVMVPELRPAEIAGDHSPVVAALQHALAAFERTGPRVDAVVLLQPTSPFRTSEDIDRAIELFERSGADTVTAVRPARDHPYWTWRERDTLIEPFFSLTEMAMDRHVLPPAYAENGAVYVIKRELVLAGQIYGARIVPYAMAQAASVDVDTPLDLAWAEFLLGRADAQ
jgi:CMP-N,N'-diacetyllegionaminic acid synthase